MIQLEFAGNGYIGKQIQKYREERGMSRAELAELLNVTMPTIHRWETGIRTPNLSTLMNLANILGVNLDELVGSAQPS